MIAAGRRVVAASPHRHPCAGAPPSPRRHPRLAASLAGLFGVAVLCSAGCADRSTAPLAGDERPRSRPAGPGDELVLFSSGPDFRLSPQAEAILPRPAYRRTAARGGIAATPGIAAASRIPVVVRPPRAFRTSQLGGGPEARPDGDDRVIAASGMMPLISSPDARPAEPAGRIAAVDPTPLRADAGPSEDPAVAGIRRMLHDYLAALNRHDAHAAAAHWTDAAECVDLASGEQTIGRDAVEEVFDLLFETDAGTSVDLEIVSIRPVRDDVAVVDAVSHLSFSPDAGHGAARSRLSAVVSREDGRWCIESVRESPLPVDAETASIRRLDELDWLVGEWEDAGDGVSARIRCFWSTGHAFLIRCHFTSYDPPGQPPAPDAADGIPGLLPPGSADAREITEIIGWDPRTESIRSWVFTSHGRIAEGTWTRRGDRWIVRMEGQGADLGTHCTGTLERIGTDELAFRCTGDAIADAMPPACDFTRSDR